jgi:hypothetical protein
MLTKEEVLTWLTGALEDYYLPPVDDDPLGEFTAGAGADDRYVLLEHGSHGATWLTTHATLDEASDYTLNQEYAEDWAATVALDRETGQEFVPRQLVWAPRGQSSETMFITVAIDEDWLAARAPNRLMTIVCDVPQENVRKVGSLVDVVYEYPEGQDVLLEAKVVDVR